ncbi:MAG: rane protein of unknown function [Candidatus Saccharibacteria bacterium]|nr:rane protein of unknown function [Candidatus Saccharibacteria bacterium]
MTRYHKSSDMIEKNEAKQLKRSWLLDGIIIVSLLALFAVLTLIGIENSSIWFDEAFSAYITQFNFVDIARYTATDVHPPLYYWLLKSWELVFGDSALALRSLSVLFAMATGIIGYFLLKRFFGLRTAAVGLLLFVLSPMIIRYSQEARMYMLISLIVMSAVATLIKAEETKRRSLYVWYGVLLALGMWTHYLVALAWLAVWVGRALVLWSKGERGKQLLRAFFSKDWIYAHVVAVALFLPWLPYMAIQLTTIQATGFWIGPVGVDTPVNYLTNAFYYLEHGEVQGWLALLLMVVLGLLLTSAIRTYRILAPAKKRVYLLLFAMAVVPPLLLFLTSLPPLRSSWVERYLFPAIIFIPLLLAIVTTYGRHWKRVGSLALLGLVITMFAIGIGNVKYYGNFNKNSGVTIQTKQLMEKVIAHAAPGEPIIANSPWTFYEAVFYETKEHPVYFIDADTEYAFGSLDMLKYNDMHKIKDLKAFTSEHPVVWYIGFSSTRLAPPPNTSWKELRTEETFDTIRQVSNYKAVRFSTGTSAE